MRSSRMSTAGTFARDRLDRIVCNVAQSTDGQPVVVDRKGAGERSGDQEDAPDAVPARTGKRGRTGKGGRRNCSFETRHFLACATSIEPLTPADWLATVRVSASRAPQCLAVLACFFRAFLFISHGVASIEAHARAAMKHSEYPLTAGSWTPGKRGRSYSVPLIYQKLGRACESTFNARHRRSGTLWEGRYKSGLVGSDSVGRSSVRRTT